jgi:hypothetical protein
MRKSLVARASSKGEKFEMGAESARIRVIIIWMGKLLLAPLT